MKNTKTIDQLKKEGFYIDVYHGRTHVNKDTPWEIKVISRKDAEKSGVLNNYFLSHEGGFTLIEITSPEGKKVRGKHNFGKRSFNRKIGLNSALGKALKELYK